MMRNVSRPHSSARRMVLLPVLASLSLLFYLALPTGARAGANDKLKPTDPYALIFGTVWGPDDRPLYGIKVEIRRAPGKKPHWELYSDHSGEFAQRVPAGEADYVVSADARGVKTSDGRPLHLKEQVTVHVEYDERVDMSLHLAE
jgi:hypothetical protein